ncbi:hypothetical protein OG552_29785 [Streptomyces sp. NBC_01476]|uniref:hypothetical protein n=1 Tax=Streptomyces sp. NBC_01476 TaxID=2903881 RepID=UPI002E357EEF|nr:hypothetical protein [Streptomyces sp. NBC_01476]
MLLVVSPILLFFVVPHIVMGGDVVMGRIGWEVFGLCSLVLPFLVARFTGVVVGEHGIAVRRACWAQHVAWDEIGTVSVESRGWHLLLVCRRRKTGRVRATLTFVGKADRRRLIEAIAARVAEDSVIRDEVLAQALGHGSV